VSGLELPKRLPVPEVANHLVWSVLAIENKLLTPESRFFARPERSEDAKPDFLELGRRVRE
jgi:hypothetical protein